MSPFSTRAAIEKGMKGVKLLDFFSNNPKGSPVGYTKNMPTFNVYLPAAAIATVAKYEEANKEKKYQEEQPQTNKRRKNYHNAENFDTLKYSVCNILLNRGAAFNRHGIPKSTLKDHSFKFKSIADLLDIPFGDVTREQYFGAISKQTPPLPSMDDVTFLLETIIPRDRNNNRMG